MDWILRTMLYNLAVQSGATAAVVIAAIGILQARCAVKWPVVVTVAGISVVVMTTSLTALKWHFRVEYPGNYPFAFHVIFAAVPVIAGAVGATVATLAFQHFRAVPPN
jgi:hypothetical protein